MKKFTLPKKPLLSIVTPSFNSGKYLEECIKSILSQDYPRVEHIIQDGASTDGITKKVLRKFKTSKYKHRIHIFSESDNGQSDGLNKAIQKAKGDILLVLNADDCLLPHAASWAIENFRKYPNIAVVYGDVYTIDERSAIIDIFKAHEFSFEKLLAVELVPPAQAAFIRRQALEKVGFNADVTLDTCPDFEMWVRIAQKFPMKHVVGIVTKYRHHDKPQHDSGQRRTTQRFVKAKREVMDRLFNDPKTPHYIKRLRRRAYASLYLWASYTAYDLGQTKQAVLYLVKSFILMPTLHKLWKIFKELRGFLRYRLTLLIKSIKHAL
ncbi:glycosyltransferase [Candidatus Daviesbacteria bacterium]|nr:glycosyltransferase [Candidatus Daviesbacteria bacterium]